MFVVNVRSQNANIDRDIVFTPNVTVQLPGKVMYFDPNEFETITRELHLDDDSDDEDDESDNHNEHVPWLEPLKHALYLVLNQKVNGNSDGR